MCRSNITFRPRGILGRIYWYMLYPFHLATFSKNGTSFGGPRMNRFLNHFRYIYATLLIGACPLVADEQGAHQEFFPRAILQLLGLPGLLDCPFQATRPSQSTTTLSPTSTITSITEVTIKIGKQSQLLILLHRLANPI